MCPQALIKYFHMKKKPNSAFLTMFAMPQKCHENLKIILR